MQRNLDHRFALQIAFLSMLLPLKVCATSGIPDDKRQDKETTLKQAYAKANYDKVADKKYEITEIPKNGTFYAVLQNMLYQLAEQGIQDIKGYTYEQLSSIDEDVGMPNIAYWLSRQPYAKDLNIHIGYVHTMQSNDFTSVTINKSGFSIVCEYMSTQTMYTLVKNEKCIGLIDYGSNHYLITDTREQNNTRQFQIVDSQLDKEDSFWMDETTLSLKLFNFFNHFLFVGPRQDTKSTNTLIKHDTFSVKNQEKIIPNLFDSENGIDISIKKKITIKNFQVPAKQNNNTYMPWIVISVLGLAVVGLLDYSLRGKQRSKRGRSSKIKLSKR